MGLMMRMMIPLLLYSDQSIKEIVATLLPNQSFFGKYLAHSASRPSG